jgi:hypothetical protein
MEEQAKSAAHRMFRFSLRSLISFTVTIGAVLGWYSAQKNFQRVAAQLEIKQHILDGACVHPHPPSTSTALWDSRSTTIH